MYEMIHEIFEAEVQSSGGGVEELPCDEGKAHVCQTLPNITQSIVPEK